MSSHAAPVYAGPTATTAPARRASASSAAAAPAGVPRYLQPRGADAEGPVEAAAGVTSSDLDSGADGTPPSLAPLQVAPIPPPMLSGSPTVTLPAVDAASTPSGMPDRIPPRVDTDLVVGVAGWMLPMLDVMLAVEGGGGGHGSATVNGVASFGVAADTTVQLRGVDQTAPGIAGTLALVARQGGVELARSAGFSVSSVPQNWSTRLVRAIVEPDVMGMVAENAWESDSGVITDLDEVKRKEQIEVTTATGPWAGATQGVSGWKDATLGSIEDHHRDSPRSAFRAAGSKIANQVFIFKCARTGAVDITARRSGLLITRSIAAGTAGVFNYDISKVGTAVTANGFTSAAAAGSSSAPTQVV